MGTADASVDSILLEHTQDKIVVIDEDGSFQYVNEAAQHILGYEPESLLGESAFQYIHPEDKQECASTFERVIASAEPTTETVRYRFRAADGSWTWLESRFSNVTDENLDGYVISSRDVTAQMDAEQKRVTAEEHLVEFSHVVGDVIWMFSPDWEELLFVNPAYEQLYGQSTETLEADPTAFLDQVHPADRDCVEDAMERLSDGEPVDIEYRVDPTNDYDKTVWVQGQPIEKNGDVVRIIGFTRDVSDRKRRERQLAVMDNLLRHNLRNDLSIILGQAELIARQADEPSANRAELIRTQGQELLETAEKQRTIIDLLTENRGPEPVDVSALIGRAVTSATEEYPELSMDVTCPDGVEAFARREVGAGILELLENVAKHHDGPEPSASIAVTRGDDRVHLELQDSCPPIPEEEFRVLTGDREMNRVYHNSGLGLWLVYWAVDLSGGIVTFERSEEGNVVTIGLPSAPADS